MLTEEQVNLSHGNVLHIMYNVKCTQFKEEDNTMLVHGTVENKNHYFWWAVEQN